MLAHSIEGRNIDIFTLSSYKDMTDENEEYTCEELFPLLKVEPRVKKFHPDKMIIFLTARVHPGETPSSYAMRGIVKFLLSIKDCRA